MSNVDSPAYDDAPSPPAIAGVTLTRQVGSTTLSLEVDPRSWLFPDHGVQVIIHLVGEAVHNGYIYDPALWVEQATEADLLRMLESVKLVPCRRCTAPAFDPATVRTTHQGLCHVCYVGGLAAQVTAHPAPQDAEEYPLDTEQRAAGMTHRVDAWVHGSGDEVSLLTLYFAGEPPPGSIRQALEDAGSTVLDDYEVVPLAL